MLVAVVMVMGTTAALENTAPVAIAAGQAVQGAMRARAGPNAAAAPQASMRAAPTRMAPANLAFLDSGETLRIRAAASLVRQTPSRLLPATPTAVAARLTRLLAL
jgi:hypothetical protein